MQMLVKFYVLLQSWTYQDELLVAADFSILGINFALLVALFAICLYKTSNISARNYKYEQERKLLQRNLSQQSYCGD